MFRLLVAALFFVLGFVEIALGQEVAQAASEGGIMENLSSYLNAPGLAKLLAFMVCMQISLRCLAEVFTRVGAWTETKWDNKIGAWLSEASWVIGVVLGKVGYGTPKLVIEEAAEKKQVEVKGD